MAQTYPLDRVIRKVPPGGATADAQRIVTVLVGERTVVPRRPFPWSDVQYFLVSHHGDPTHQCRVEIPAVALADLDEQVEVSVNLLVNCPPGDEARVTLALFDPVDAPHAMLERHVVRCLRDLGQADVGAFTRRFFADPAAVQQDLAEALARGTGLRVHARLSLDQGPDRDVVRVEVAHLAVLAADWDEEQDLAIRVDLEVDDAGLADAVLSRARMPELNVIVPREIRAFVRRRISLAELPRIGAGAARQALVSHLDDVLRPLGRRVGALVLQPANVQGAPPDQLAVLEVVDVPCTVREYPRPVTIANRVLLRVVDLVRYRGEASPELRTWLRDTLNRLVPETLFEARYTDLLLRFDRWEERIKQAVRAAAEGIGCEISQFITDPDLPEKILVKPFVIRTEGAFETRLHGVDAKLEVVVTARIPRLEDIASLLAREPDIPRAMEEAVRTALEARMHALHPERFYMRFGFADPVRHAEETQSVEAELMEHVERRLTEGEFHAEVVGTVIKIVETDLIRRFRELQEATPDFVLRVESLDAEVVDFAANLRVGAVHYDGWQRFRVLTGGIEQITARVRDQVDTVLHTLPAAELLYQGEAERSALEARVSAAVLQYAAEQFGLVVHLANFRRTRTESETAYHATLRGEWQREAEARARLQETAVGARLNEYAGMAAAIERLTERCTELYGVEGEEKELARVEREIAALSSRLREHSRLPLDAGPDRDVVRVEMAHLAVFASDWDEEQGLAIRIDLELGDTGRADVVLSRARLPDLHAIVPREIRAFVRRQISLAEFPKIGAGEARQALVSHLDEVLRPLGRRVGALVLQPGNVLAAPQDQPSVLEVVDVPCTVREYPRPVTIANRVLLRVVDLVKYRGEASPELRTWLRDTLNRLVPETLFDACYTDLLLRFDRWEERIKQAVHAAAERIGCEISQFITDPDLPEKILVKPFVIRTEGAFETRLHGVEAKLEVVVTARIPRLEDIASLLAREPDIPRAMEVAVRTAIEVGMHTLHPERFYIRFGFADPLRHAEETQSVEAELMELVERRLTEGEFHAEVVGTVIKIVEPDLIRGFRELQEATPDFVLRVESLDAEVVDFAASLRVVAVHNDGWQRFRVLTGGIEQITANVRDQVDTVLHTLPAAELLYQGEAERSALEARVSTAVLQYATEQFGLVVRLSNFRRTRTESETAYHATLRGEWQREVKTHARLQEAAAGARLNEYVGMAAAIERLTERRTELYGVEGEEEELERVERDIAALESRMGTVPAASAAQLRRRASGTAAVDRAFPAGAAVDAVDLVYEGEPEAAPTVES